MLTMFRDPMGFLHVRTDGDTTALPIDLDISKSRASGILSIVVGTAVSLLSAGVYYGVDRSGIPFAEVLVTAVVLLLALVGLLQIGRGVLAVSGSRHLRIADSTVSVQGKSLFGSENWSEPLGAYQGVRWREFTIRKRDDASTGSTTEYWQYIDLAHPDPKRCVPLHVSMRKDGARAEWENLARVLGLSAIDARGGEATVRAAQDLDKSVRELAKEGKVLGAWSGETAPSGLEVDYSDPDRIVVTITALRMPLSLFLALAGFGSLLIIVGILDMAFLPILFGGAMAGGAVWFRRKDAQVHRAIILTRSDVILRSPSLISVGATEESIPHAQIEAVAIQDGDKRQAIGRQVVLSTDGGDHKAGSGLSDEALTWLRNLIVAAIASA